MTNDIIRVIFADPSVVIEAFTKGSCSSQPRFPSMPPCTRWFWFGNPVCKMCNLPQKEVTFCCQCLLHKTTGCIISVQKQDIFLFQLIRWLAKTAGSLNNRLPPLGERWLINQGRWNYKDIKYNLHVILGTQANMHTVVITWSVTGVEGTYTEGIDWVTVYSQIHHWAYTGWIIYIRNGLTTNTFVFQT